MPTKRFKASRLEMIPRRGRSKRRYSARTTTNSKRKMRGMMVPKGAAKTNEYVCAIERNQNGKYNVRVRATYGPPPKGANGDGAATAAQGSWTLPVYFLASSFNGAMKKLEETLQLLQKNEEKLRFWGVERTDDPKLTGELLRESGLGLDRRREFPRKVAQLGVPRERPVPASMLAPLRRVLADSIAPERPVDRERGRVLPGD
jgi:hypothetical protein